jgi:hypothetical protein
MDPLITNGIEPAMLQELEKHGRERDQVPHRRKRTSTPAETVKEENETEADIEAPKHNFDDLA